MTTILFTAKTAANGEELWVTDGTEAGTVLLKDINPGPDFSVPAGFTVSGSLIYFSAGDPTNGYELWVTDGTPSGTKLIKDVSPGLSPSVTSSGPRIDLDGKLIYVAKDATSQYELWTSDGTDAGTVMLKDINPGAGNSGIGWLHKASGRVYFAANNGTTGSELWTTDGTAAGTVMVQDIRPGAFGSNPFPLGVVNNRVIFSADDGTNGSELWSVSGTTATLLQIRPGTGSPGVQDFVNLGGRAVFTADDGTNGRELWSTDGTTAGTFMVADLDSGWLPGETGGEPSSDIEFLGQAGNKALFRFGHVHNGDEIWVTDGTNGGAFRLLDADPASTGVNPFWSTPTQKLDSHAVFVAEGPAFSFDLYISDGTATGTRKLDSAGLFDDFTADDFVQFGNSIIFSADSPTLGYEVFIASANGGAATLLKDIAPGALDSFASGFTVVDGKVYFQAQSTPGNLELWVSDGTSAGTFLLKDIEAGGESAPRNFLPVVFAANTAPTNIALSNARVREYAATGTDVGTLSATDAQGGAMTYALLNNAGGRFKITGNTLEVANGLLLDYEQAASHKVQVRATDSGGLSFTKTLTVSITDVNPEIVTGDSSANIFTGGALADRLRGMAGNDTLRGNAGADTLDGGAGNDTMTGGDGSDTYVVDSLTDVLSETNSSLAAGGDDLVQSSVSRTLGANFERLTLTGAAAINGTGNALANTLTGNGAANVLKGQAGHDQINGAAGNDVLFGELGNDTLTGGIGRDTFVFNTALGTTTNRDTITDFRAVDDTFQLDNAVFTGLGPRTGTLLIGQFNANSAGLAQDADDRIIYNTATGVLTYDSNGNIAGGLIQQFAVLTGRPAISYLDFIVI